VDFSPLEIRPELTAATRRFVRRVLGAAALRWLGLMTALPLHAAG